jgi:hypothetical protein
MNINLILIIVFVGLMGTSKITYAGASFLHQIFVSHEKLYKPIVSEKFSLFEKNYSKIFKLNYKYKDRYSFGITNADIGFSGSFEFSGVLKLEFFAKGEKLYEEIVDKQDVKWYLTGSENRFKQITLSYFDIPLQGRYKKDLSVKVTVIEPDPNMKEFGDTVNVVIGVSATP